MHIIFYFKKKNYMHSVTLKQNEYEFIHLIASEANEICEKDTKKTIAGEHVVSALQVIFSKIIFIIIKNIIFDNNI